MYSYILCQFTYGFVGQFYQEVNEVGIVIRMADISGTTIEPESPYGAEVIDDNPPKPFWA